ncbi:Zinc-binding dehydrogenase [Rhizoctonia solani]|uniref:Zinc-binding dehydrogenase n=1 Tax=Rhizoctonia solani TaxID=456999 RepID=A0A8H8P132_9AGAM|nr:Zinc-binding dehydrogenase [Rhizoctonia solani]QRW22593.1 Zinc-binding dehydrogenase [Rhizoctonia solani]
MAFSIPTVAKAWRYPPSQPSSWNSYHSLELRNIPIPVPGKGEVLVKMHAAALNSRVNQEIRTVTYPSSPKGYTMGPDGGGLIPTSDGTGEIVAVGEGVAGWAIGDRVHSLVSESWVSGPLKPEYWPTALGSETQGCLAQYRIFPAEFILPIPDHLSYEEAASNICAGMTAFHALFDSGKQLQNSTVLVLGSGGVSVLGAQFAKAAGARVIATTSSQEKAQKYKDLGVDHVINYRETPNWVEEVKKVTDGQGVDQVLEIGGKGTLMGAIRSMNAGGVVHLIGSSQDDTPITGFFDLTVALMSSEIKLNGVAVGGKDVGQRLDSFLSQHNLNPFLDPKVFGWHDAKEAFAYLESGAHFGKVVVRID